MAPPFIAYYGALYQPYVNSNLLYTAYDQIRLYRNYLYDPSVGLWKHVVLGDFEDDGYWSTGELLVFDTISAHQHAPAIRQRMGCRWDPTRAGDDEPNDLRIPAAIRRCSERLAELGDGDR